MNTYTKSDTKHTIGIAIGLAILCIGLFLTILYGDLEAIIRAVGSTYAKFYFWSSVVTSFVCINMLVEDRNIKDWIGTVMVAFLLGWITWPFLLWGVIKKGRA